MTLEVSYFFPFILTCLLGDSFMCPATGRLFQDPIEKGPRQGRNLCFAFQFARVRLLSFVSASIACCRASAQTFHTRHPLRGDGYWSRRPPSCGSFRPNSLSAQKSRPLLSPVQRAAGTRLVFFVFFCVVFFCVVFFLFH